MEQPDARVIGERIEALRLAIGETRTEFTDRIGLDISTYAKFVRGERLIGLLYIYRLYLRHKVEPQFFLLEDFGGVPVQLRGDMRAALRQLRRRRQEPDGTPDGTADVAADAVGRITRKTGAETRIPDGSNPRKGKGFPRGG